MTTQILPPSKNQPRYDHRHHDHHHHHDNDHNDNSENYFLTKFWAVQRCDALESPVIFTNWNDCSYYIENQQRKQQQQQRGVDDDDCDGAGIIFEEFDNIIDAVQFILPENQPLTIPRTTYAKKITTTTTTIITRKNTAAKGHDDSVDEVEEEFSTTRRPITQRKSTTLSTTRTRQREMPERTSVDLPCRTEGAGVAANVAAMPAVNPQTAIATGTPFLNPTLPNQQNQRQQQQQQQEQQEQEQLFGTDGSGKSSSNMITGALAAGATAPPTLENFVRQNTEQDKYDTNNNSNNKRQQKQQEKLVKPLTIDENWMKRFAFFQSFVREFPRGERIGINHLPDDKKEKYKSIVDWQQNEKKRMKSYLIDPINCTPQSVAKVTKLKNYCDEVGYGYFNFRPKQLREITAASAAMAASASDPSGNTTTTTTTTTAFAAATATTGTTGTTSTSTNTRRRKRKRRKAADAPSSNRDSNGDGAVKNEASTNESSPYDKKVDNDEDDDQNDENDYDDVDDLAMQTDDMDDDNDDNYSDNDENENDIVRNENNNDMTTTTTTTTSIIDEER